jgi:hypothetical protein
MMTRDAQGRQVWAAEDTDEGIGMTITNGATYRFKGHDYLATLEDTSSDTLACFQRLPINQIDDEPELFLDRNDGSLCDDTGTNVGDYREMEPLDA